MSPVGTYALIIAIIFCWLVGFILVIVIVLRVVVLFVHMPVLLYLHLSELSCSDFYDLLFQDAVH